MVQVATAKPAAEEFFLPDFCSAPLVLIVVLIVDPFIAAWLAGTATWAQFTAWVIH